MELETIYKLQADGTYEITTVEHEGPSIEDQIADREAQLLEMYQELETLKSQIETK